MLFCVFVLFSEIVEIERCVLWSIFDFVGSNS